MIRLGSVSITRTHDVQEEEAEEDDDSNSKQQQQLVRHVAATCEELQVACLPRRNVAESICNKLTKIIDNY